jgi:serine/threonine protein kinase
MRISVLLVEFQVEVLSRVRHPNLLTLIGSCAEYKSLVYEYLNNGSLESHLACKDKTPLPWQIRISIATDICSALIFLHSSEPCIIHGNLKPSKVLLDANFVAKLGDLGIPSLVQHSVDSADTSPVVCNNSHENLAYVDPEYLDTGKLTPESDVYSFGIILLQLLTGRPLSGLVRDMRCALEKENLKTVLDLSAGEWPLYQTTQLAYLALRCCEKTWLNRPDLVSEVWSVLKPFRTICIDRRQELTSKKLQRAPSHFVCPIVQVKIIIHNLFQIHFYQKPDFIVCNILGLYCIENAGNCNFFPSKPETHLFSTKIETLAYLVHVSIAICSLPNSVFTEIGGHTTAIQILKSKHCVFLLLVGGM